MNTKIGTATPDGERVLTSRRSSAARHPQTRHGEILIYELVHSLLGNIGYFLRQSPIQPRLRWPIFFLFVLLAACAMVRAPTAEELARLENPPSEVRRLQDLLTPLALQWLGETEAELLSKGRPLSEEETTMARTVGVEYPERVRVIVLAELPLPSNETLRTETIRYGLGSSAEGGRTMGYVIMLKAKYAKKRWILAHELTHVAQQERMGRAAFIRRFIAEQELMGYRRAPLELEANELALKFK